MAAPKEENKNENEIEDNAEIQELLHKKVFQCKLSSDIQVLDILHQKWKWIPGKENVRPNADILDKKLKYMDTIQHFYASEKDYIYENIFCFDSVMDGGKLMVRDEAIKRKAIFVQNIYPYDLDDSTHHYIMWYSFYDESVTEQKINDDINIGIQNIVKHKNFDYIWYLNPKMTIPDIFHVQVFWTIIKDTNIHQLNDNDTQNKL